MDTQPNQQDNALNEAILDANTAVAVGYSVADLEKRAAQGEPTPISGDAIKVYKS